MMTDQEPNRDRSTLPAWMNEVGDAAKLLDRLLALPWWVKVPIIGVATVLVVWVYSMV